MYLGSSLLPIKLSVDEALVKVKEVLQEKNWSNFELGTMKLVLVPYFYFNYHFYKEKNKGEDKIIESSVDGYLALNGKTLKIEEKTTDLIKKNLNEKTNVAPTIEFELVETSVDKREQDDVVKFKTAEFFTIPKQNIVISSAKKYLVPFYEVFITINENTHKININAITGDLIGSSDVPIREKGFIEITKETIDDLSTSKGWIQYSKELLSKTKNKTIIKEEKFKKKEDSFQMPSLDLSIFSSKWVLILIIILALFLIFVALFF